MDEMARGGYSVHGTGTPCGYPGAAWGSVSFKLMSPKQGGKRILR